MQDRTLFRWGSWAAIVGGIALLAVNFTHPRLESFEDPIAEELRIVGESGGWIALHLGILAAFLLVSFGLFAVARSMKGGPAEGIARVAVGSLLISTSISSFALLIDGYALKAITESIAGDAALAPAGIAVAELAWAGFMGVVIFGLGVTPAIFGMAVARDGRYPAWLGWAASIFGLVAIGTGVTGVLDGPSSGFFIVFSAASGILTLWVIAIGAMLGRRVSGTVVVPEGTTAKGKTSAGIR